MAIELMDGRTGENHISSEDWATFNAATYGVAEGVFDWGDGFKLTMSTSNKGTVGTGAGLVDGKRVWVKVPESVTIESGGQGVKRNDIVGIQYETHGASLERAVVKVVKGAAASTPKDPSLPSKFLPLWRVPLDGLNVGAPVAIFEKIPSVAGLRDSVSPTTDWVPVWQSDDISMKTRRIGRTAWLEAESYGGFQVEANRWKDVSRLPGGFAPSTTIHGAGTINGERPLSVSIQTDGLIRAHGSISGSYWMFSMSWPVG